MLVKRSNFYLRLWWLTVISLHYLCFLLGKQPSWVSPWWRGRYFKTCSFGSRFWFEWWEGGGCEDRSPAGQCSCGQYCSQPLFLLFLYRPMSGTRMMTGCCRPWRMEMRRRWPHCSARRGPVPPNTTARARPRKLKHWFADMPVMGFRGCSLESLVSAGEFHMCSLSTPILKYVRRYFNLVPFSPNSKSHMELYLEWVYMLPRISKGFTSQDCNQL